MTSRDVLLTLAEHTGWPSVSLYLHTHRTVAEKEQDRIRFKNLVKSACEDLVAAGLSQTEATTVCAPANELLESDAFWRESSDGLAVFVSSDEMTVMRLDTPVSENSVVGDRYYLRPLFAAHRGERRFYALALDKGGCRLFRGDGAAMEQLELEGAPESLADELKYDQREESMQLQTFAGPQARAGTGRGQGMFHGHGGEKDVENSDRERYFRKVERVVSKIVPCDEPIPLLLLGVEYEIASYRALNTCKSLVDVQVTGSTAELSPHQIHLAALEALESHFDAVSRGVVDDIAEKEGSGLVTHGPTEIVEAAVAGRVRALLFDGGKGPFGVFDRETFKAEVVCIDPPEKLREKASSDAPDSCGWDLVDLAAAETLLQGGDIFAFDGENSPVEGVVALLRY